VDQLSRHLLFIAAERGARNEDLLGICEMAKGFLPRFRRRMVPLIDDDEIEAYLESEMWRGKAGAYNITERLAAGWPITFTGDETSIVGLPMTRTLERVAQFFVD